MMKTAMVTLVLFLLYSNLYGEQEKEISIKGGIADRSWLTIFLPSRIRMKKVEVKGDKLIVEGYGVQTIEEAEHVIIIMHIKKRSDVKLKYRPGAKEAETFDIVYAPDTGMGPERIKIDSDETRGEIRLKISKDETKINGEYKISLVGESLFQERKRIKLKGKFEVTSSQPIFKAFAEPGS